jgi:hypothetical protein
MVSFTIPKFGKRLGKKTGQEATSILGFPYLPSSPYLKPRVSRISCSVSPDIGVVLLSQLKTGGKPRSGIQYPNTLWYLKWLLKMVIYIY